MDAKDAGVCCHTHQQLSDPGKRVHAIVQLTTSEPQLAASVWETLHQQEVNGRGPKRLHARFMYQHI
jgi:hypothetical protein